MIQGQVSAPDATVTWDERQSVQDLAILNYREFRGPISPGRRDIRSQYRADTTAPVVRDRLIGNSLWFRYRTDTAHVETREGSPTGWFAGDRPRTTMNKGKYDEQVS